MVSCITKKYCQSKNCKREMTLADQQGKHVIPLKCEEMDLAHQGGLSLIFSGRIYIKMTQGLGHIPQDKFEELVQKIKQHVNNAREEAPEPGYLTRFAKLVGLDRCMMM